MAPMLDVAVWTKVEEILTQPEIIASEVSRLRDNDPTTADLGSIARRTAELNRQRTNLTKPLALFDDDEAVAPLVVEIEALTKQQRQLEQERGEIESMRAGWVAAQSRREDLEYWCRVQSANLESMTYEQKRLALWALNTGVRVWATNHTPRYTVTLTSRRHHPK